MTEARSTLPLPACAVATLGFSWPLLIGLLAMAAVLGSKQIDILADPDTYLHIAAGRWMLANGAVPLADPFSHTMPGAPWLAHEWLAELLISGVYQWGGWTALGLMNTLVFAATLAGLMRFLLARMEPVHAVLFTTYAGCMLVGYLLARPHVLAWPLLALWVGTLVGALERGQDPPWWLIAVMVLWANLHGSFMLGLALGAGLALEATLYHPAGQRRAAAGRWARFVVLALVAAVATPTGWRGLLFPLHLLHMSVALEMIGEWSSPDFHQAQLLELWLMLALALACSGRLRLPWIRLLLVLALTHLALKYQRNVGLLGLVAPLLVARPWGHQWRATGSSGRDIASIDRVFLALAAPANAGAIASAAVASAVLVGLSAQSGRFVPAVRYAPEAALHAAQRAGAVGPVLNAYNFGGYLIFQSIRVFIDGRADLYGDTFMKRYQDASTLAKPEALPQLLAQHHITWTLLEPGTPAIALLDRLPGWQRVYADDVAVVHVLRN